MSTYTPCGRIVTEIQIKPIKFQKIIKNSTHNVDSYMNVIFEKKQTFKNGEVLEWELQGEVLPVFIIEYKKLFVKGKHFHVYAVGIIE
ncbi:hypothetical protein ABR36_03465 [Enterobacter ludwigii]|nr:hypothetical protein ABR36_03465 [Enterobacter ludwigii]